MHATNPTGKPSPNAGQNDSGPASRFKPVDPLRVIRQYLVLLIVTAVVGAGLGVGTYLTLRTFSPTYTSSMAIEAKPGSVDLEKFSVSDTTGLSQTELAIYINTQANMVMREDLLRRALQRDAVADTQFVQNLKQQQKTADQPWFDLGVEKLLEDGLLTARHEAQTAHLTVAAHMRNKNDARPILDTVVNVYMDEVEQRHMGSSANLRQAILAERDRAREQVQNLQEQQRTFRQRYEVSTLDQAHSEAGIDYQELAKRRAELEAALAQASSSYESMRQRQQQGNLEPTPTELTRLQRRRSVEQRIDRLAQLREQHEVHKQEYGENHPFTKRIERQIEALKAEKKNLIRDLLRDMRASDLAQSQQAVESYKDQLASTREKLEAASTRLTELGTRLNRYRALEDQLEAAKMRREQANEALKQIRIKQGPLGMPMQRASSPSEPELTSPDPIITVGGVALLLLGLVTGLVFLREVIDQRLRAPSDVALIPEAEVLGAVPDTSEDPSGRRRIEGAVERHPTGLLAECFRQVRTAVLSKMDRRGYRTLVLAGAQPGCGTSSVVQNLGSSLGHNGRRVLILDCNFRRPQQHALAGLENDQGLVEVLQGEATLEDAIQPLEGTNVAVLPTGQSQEAHPELLESQAFRTTLSQLESQYDFILLDAPPALLTSECRMLAKLVDALAIVARADREKRGMVNRMLRQIEGQRADILGIILNGVQSSAGGYFRKSYQAFYEYSTNGENGHAGPRRSRGAKKSRTRSPAKH
jgi:capsular exopolysaccharide synthesis family protein